MGNLPVKSENNSRKDSLNMDTAKIISEVQGIPLEIAETFLSVKGKLRQTGFCNRKIKVNDLQK